jgi:hypothetical protein
MRSPISPGVLRLENFSAYSPWRRHPTRPRREPSRVTCRNRATPGTPTVLRTASLRWHGNEADSRSDLQLYVVAGVGFEPT